MTEPVTEAVCALCGEPGAGSRPTVPARVDGSERAWQVHLHASCLAAVLRAGVVPVTGERPGGIPGDAACGVCGKRLPIVGRHPYAVTLGESGAAEVWFIHAQCLPGGLRGRAGPSGDGNE